MHYLFCNIAKELYQLLNESTNQLDLKSPWCLSEKTWTILGKSMIDSKTPSSWGLKPKNVAQDWAKKCFKADQWKIFTLIYLIPLLQSALRGHESSSVTSFLTGLTNLISFFQEITYSESFSTEHSDDLERKSFEA